jgi:hypothetical protein
MYIYILSGKFGNYKTRGELPTVEYENPMLLQNGQGGFTYVCILMYIYMYIYIYVYMYVY